MATTIKQKAPIEGAKKKLVFFENGRKIVFIVPDFEGRSTILKNAYDDEVWKSNHSDSNNYRKQIRDAMVELGGDPQKETAHHDQPIGVDNKALPMVIVTKEEHRKQKHYGASSIANSDKRKDFIKKAKNWNISRVEYYRNFVDYHIHKHPTASSCVVAGTAAVLTDTIIKKTMPNAGGVVRVCLALGVGLISGLLTNSVLTSKNTYYADSSF